MEDLNKFGGAGSIFWTKVLTVVLTSPPKLTHAGAGLRIGRRPHPNLRKGGYKG